ncbi:hypothetical protein FDECE_12858 [Fusarium decemcellulare]|nr:hypothetical protein FDECE_12858 [Fusarium decemcellulare]
MRSSVVVLTLLITYVAALRKKSDSFVIDIDDSTGAVIGITDPKSDNRMNWVSSPANAPWQPLGSRWGLGFADLGESFLHRYYWKDPDTSSRNGVHVAEYKLGDLRLKVSRWLKDKAFHEQYTFENQGKSTLDLSSKGTTSLGIYTPFNDHYTNTSDALAARFHAHIWANGGATAWVKMNQMGGYGRNLGLVVTEGALGGYSVEGRDTVTSSNTRGVFVLHPTIGELGRGESSSIAWTMFWHGDWQDFWDKCATYSSQFIRFDAPSYTVFEGESVNINMTGSANSALSINGLALECNRKAYTFEYSKGRSGQEALIVTKDNLNSTIYLNTVPPLDKLIPARVNFIIDNQQISDPDDPTDGAYRVFDNQANSIAVWDTATDRNSGRERLGMGILMARYLRKHPNDTKVRTSLETYYNFVSLKLQNESGYVFDRPAGTGTSRHRLYNWPWVMQFHANVALLDINLTGPVASKTPEERFLLTMESFYQEGGEELYAIGLPILEGIQLLKRSKNRKGFDRALSLFVRHGENIARRGTDYPPFEVNFEQSIVAPAAIMMAELYRATGNKTFLEAAKLQLDTLDRFVGHQPDYRLHEVAIRHWDGYWFGKDRLWGDTFPHHWSTLNALALHHLGTAIGSDELKYRADAVNRANLALFKPNGHAGCAWVYPLSVNGRAAHYLDHYANDQDWVLAHILQIEQDQWGGKSLQ